MTEIYKDIPNYGGIYQVSNKGNVKSFKNDIPKKLKPSCKKTYLGVTLSMAGKLKTLQIHQLVAMAFLNHIPSRTGLVVDHVDGNPLNNNLNNLQLLTTRQNTSKGWLAKETTSIYTGVCWNKQDKKWRASIKIKGRTKYLGNFIEEFDARDAYKKALDNV